MATVKIHSESTTFNGGSYTPCLHIYVGIKVVSNRKADSPVQTQAVKTTVKRDKNTEYVFYLIPTTANEEL